MRNVVGRFAPSPTGELHLGNLRTALLAWLSARSAGGRFIVRMEDLDRVTSSREHELEQLAALAAIGLDWDGEVVRQSERFGLYDAAIGELTSIGRTYECYCTRREIRDAISAPHDGHLAYPGTCRDLTVAERGAMVAEGRRPAIRLRTNDEDVGLDVGLEFIDEFADELADERLGAGAVRVAVDDVVLRRNDGVPAYNLAVVVDDAAQGVTEVVRGDDLMSSTPSQVLLQRLLGLTMPTYRHVPLVLGADRVRLAKRHGAVTLGDLAGRGLHASAVLDLLAVSLGLATTGESVPTGELLQRFEWELIPRQPWIIPVDLQRSVP